MSRAGCVWGGLFLMACGGAAPPPAASAEDAPKEEAVSEASEKLESAAKSDTKAAPEEEGASKEASGDELGTILQRVIEDGELDQYLHLTAPGRFPLKISGEKLSGISLTKGGKPVEVVSGPKDKKDPVLEISTLEIEGTKATVTYKYAVEGIRGTARLEKGPRGWELKNSRIVEH